MRKSLLATLAWLQTALRPTLNSTRTTRLALMLACGLSAALPCGLPGSALAAAPALADVPGSQDPAILARFSGATLIGYRRAEFESASMPLAAAINRDAPGKPFAQLQAVEGTRVRAVYLAPAGKTPLEVYRNYEQALSAAGFRKTFSCESHCDDQYFAVQKLGLTDDLQWSSGAIAGSGNDHYNVQDAVAYNEGRLLVGTLPQAGVQHAVLLWVSKAVNDATPYTAVLLQVVSPRAMQSGQVKVLKAQELQSALGTDGKVALYGIYFDTNKSQLKSESAAQIAEMSALLRAQPALNAFIVGHTDAQGDFNANQTLSQQRAQAVIDALVQQGIAASRLSAKGVASLCPLASNTTEAGRARNRRVELVLR